MTYKTLSGTVWFIDSDHEVELDVEYSEVIWLDESDLRLMLAEIEKAQGVLKEQWSDSERC